MHRSRMRWIVCLVAGLAIAVVFSGPPAAGSVIPLPKDHSPLAGPLVFHPETATAAAKQIQVLVLLKEPSAAEVFERVKQEARGASAANAAAFAAAQRQFFSIDAAQDKVSAELAAPAIAATEIFRIKRAMNAISVYTTLDKLAAIRALPGVRAVHLVQPEHPTNSTSVPFVGAPQVWTDTLGLGKDLTGAGVTIGIIDTGIDYLHANFGGDGQSATYTAAAAATSNFTTLGGGFPSAKVVGGWDFAGDMYNGGNPPVPDANPMDCGGHGSHVAGTAAGYGVKSDNTTYYPGPYSTSVPFGSLKIGPGVAPLASLYALRVFGCGGSTGLTAQAIDWAMDPDNNGDMSDHLDVINMSLGSSFGRLSDTSAMASDAAAAVGVIVVCSTGNAGDTFFIAGSPGNGQRVISTAAGVDPGGSDGPTLTVNAPAGIAGNYLAGYATFGPALTPTGVTGNVVLANDGSANPTLGCNSSPAWPGMTGNIALIDRGTCNFTIKTKNAQLNGAIGVIVANNAAGIINMSGSDPTITIPALSVSQTDGNTIKAQLGVGVNATLRYGSFPEYADTLATFSSRGPLANDPVFLKPDITAPGQNITSTLTGWTCDGVTTTGCIWPSAGRINANSQAGVLSGTSMASPHMTGTMALLRQLHPDWSVEELKALAMNTALHNLTTGPNGTGSRYGPDRVGTGREDVPLAAQNNVAAFNGDNVGQVSVSFGTEVVGSLTATKSVRVDNKGMTDQTYTLGIDTVENNPGVSYSFPGGTNLVVPAGQSVTFNVQISATADQIKHTVDPTVAPNQTGGLFGGSWPRHWLTEEASYITFTQGATLKMRVPVFSAPEAASTMSGGPINTGGSASGSTVIALTGSGVCTATHTIGPFETCALFSFPTDEYSLVTGFELQGAHPADPQHVYPYQNLQYVGVNHDSTNDLTLFGVSTWGDWATPSDVSFTFYLDTCTYAAGSCTGGPDGNFDYAIVSSDLGSINTDWLANNVGSTDTFATFVWNLNTHNVIFDNYTNFFGANVIDTRLFNNNVLFLPVDDGLIYPGGTPGPFNYLVETCPGWAPGCGLGYGFNTDQTGPFHFNPAAQGLDFNNYWLSSDLNGSALPVTFNTANLAANGSLGALLLHHHNAKGSRAQVVLLSPDGSNPGSNLALTASANPPNPALNSNVVVTISVHNNGPNASTGVQVAALLSMPAFLNYVGDDGGGSFDVNTAVWTIPGTLASGGTATLHMTLQPEASGIAIIPLQITASTPLDTNPADNSATVIINAAGQADLSITKTVNPPNPVLGGPVIFTVTVSNAGPDTAYNVVVTDLLSASLTFQSASATAGTYDPITGHWTLASLPIGGSDTLTITAILKATTGLTNTASVTSDTDDPALANNTTTVTFTWTPPIPLLSHSALLLLAGILALGGLLLLRRSS
jgi:uncharacterized repeat protein (TIGR01451 family)